MLKKSLIAMVSLVVASTGMAGESLNSKGCHIDKNGNCEIVQSTISKADEKAEKPTEEKTAAATKQVKKDGKGIALNYSILLKSKNGKLQKVNANRSFKSGEKFKIVVNVKKPSYLYILNEDSSGNLARQIYPEQGQHVFFKARKKVTLPKEGYFVFDDEPGTEYLFIYASEEKSDFEISSAVNDMQPNVVEGGADENCNAAEDETRAKAVDYVSGKVCGNFRGKGIYSEAPARNPEEKEFETADPNLLMLLKLKHK